jgi:hypothetical protein
MILLINQTSIGRDGGLLAGVLAYQETGLTGPLSIYKVVPKVPIARTFGTVDPNKRAIEVKVHCSIWRVCEGVRRLQVSENPKG